MALSQNTYVYMETMEEAEDKGAKPNENGSSERFGMAGRNWEKVRGELEIMYPDRMLI